MEGPCPMSCSSALPVAALVPTLLRRWAAAVCLGLVLLASPPAGAVQPLRLESVVVTPDDPAVESVVRRHLGLRPGDDLDPDQLLAARSRLRASGWFESVEVYAAPGSQRGAVSLRVDAVLDRRTKFLTGYGHEPLEGWYLNLVGVRWNHLLGPGSRLDLSYQLGLRRSGLRAELVRPRLFSGPLDLLLRVRGASEDWNVFSGDTFLQQEIRRRAVGVGLRWPFRVGASLTLRLEGETADPGALRRVDQTDAEIPFDLLPRDTGRERWTSLSLELVAGNAANAARRREGRSLVVQGDLGRPEEGPAFARARMELRSTLPLPAHAALGLRIGGRWSDRATPYHLRPIFGGIGSVRGFRDASLSGPFGTRAHVSSSVEVRVPLLPRDDSDPRVHGLLFGDVGSFRRGDGTWHDPSVGVGWGLRVRMPWVDHLGIDVGIPLTPTGTEDPFWVHGRLGVGF